MNLFVEFTAGGFIKVSLLDFTLSLVFLLLINQDMISFGSILGSFFVLLHILHPWCRTDGSCYYPDTTVAAGDLSCNASAIVSTCCGKGWACLGNGLCLSTGESPDINRDIWARGSCTDRTWSSEKCVKPCEGESTFFAVKNLLDRYSLNFPRY